ncbi:MAG: 23S rRNA (pseudouridine(1915)-N(3))-methyltransferase RlmH [Thermoflavifilum sp.]|nr:23S rRNA (pseudouridine(1915)-N(3))-methyltransferase RlmH [Thermoflavifilum sp.]
MRLEIWAVARRADPALETCIHTYTHRIQHWASVHTWLIPPAHQANTQLARQIDAQKIMQRLKEKDYLVLLDATGQMLSSKEWAHWIQRLQNESIQRLIFLIGGAYGVDEVVRARAAFKLSLSTLTFPHQLVRLILAEQLYRAFTILHHLPYHHE